VQSSWIPDAEFLTQKIAQMERVVTNGYSRLALEILSQIVPTFKPLEGESAMQTAALERLRVARQSA
jgi:hypothetical protein